ncbi:MAG: hypothetical protein NE327_10515 [Lentisphaeraceae bacterium]|nr:hypothetical protein [Lentisphaeraceae bacterium]
MKTLLLAALLLLGCKSVKPPEDLHVDQLRQTILGAEELVIFDQTKNVFYQSSTSRLPELVGHIEIKEMDNGHDCLCYANFVLIFYKDGKYDFALGLHPGMGLRWTNSPWLADGLLDEFAYVLMLDWIQTEMKNGEILKGYTIPEVLIEQQ